MRKLELWESQMKLIREYEGDRLRISFDDFRRTKSYERLMAGLKALEADMRCWTPDGLVDNAYVVYARQLLVEALDGPYVDWDRTGIDERVRRVKWTVDDVCDLVYGLADNDYATLVKLNYETGRVISYVIDCMLDDKANKRRRR